MVHSIRERGRPFRVAASILLALFVLGVTSPSYASSGNGQGNGQGHGQGSDNGNPGNKGGESEKGSSHGHGEGADHGQASWKHPQPISNADSNNGGANGKCRGGPYCSTRHGHPSRNGNGQGKAIGKPCAGCVGKADNKNPPGQMPNGRDHNAGYECDRNHGVGRTNPAHTGCKRHEEHKRCKPCGHKHEEHKPAVIPHEAAPPEVVPAVTPPEAAPAEVFPAVTPPREVAGVETVVTPPAAPVQGALPPTGADAGWGALALAGAATFLAGGILVRHRRRT